MNLFIIGNGFDLAHKLNTSYNDFHNHILDKYNITDEYDTTCFCHRNEDKHGDGKVVLSDTARLLCALVNSSINEEENWSKFEDILGGLDFIQCFEALPIEDLDDKFDKQRRNEIYNCEDRAREVNDAFDYENFQHLFKDWIESIDLSKLSKLQKFVKLINPSDLFLTFNYTKTLEEVYDLNQEHICHIHGKIGEQILILGHGNDERIELESRGVPYEAEFQLEEVHRRFRKNTTARLNMYNKFFSKLSDNKIDNIYSYGFSYGEVDKPYIRVICQNLCKSEKMTWYLNDDKLSDSEFKQLIDIIKSLGFKGKFGKFSCKE